MGHRSWEERREIIKAIVAADFLRGDGQKEAAQLVAKHNLTDAELRFFRAKTQRAIARLAVQTSSFRAYYKLQTRKPFFYFAAIAVAIVILCWVGFFYLVFDWTSNDETGRYQLMAATGTVAIAAIGWAVGGWVSHRNATIQHTINIIASRFSQAVFADNMHRFHSHFGYDVHPQITLNAAHALSASQNESDRKIYQSIIYVLNYFEFIATGVINGDLDEPIVRKTLRSMVNFYFDKCEPWITEANKTQPTTMEHFIKLRAAYREP